MIEHIEEDTQEDQEQFAGMHLPRTLQEIRPEQAEKDIDKLLQGDNQDILYDKITGLGIN